jgi:hypothetical protein
MSIVDFSDLTKHAAAQGYSLTLVNAPILAIAKGALQCAEGLDAPLLLTVHGRDLEDELLPSIELSARQARVPVALIAKQISSTEQATLAIRLGCNGLILAEGLAEDVKNSIRSTAASCCIPVIENNELSGTLHDDEPELQKATLGAIEQTESSWQEIRKKVAQATASHLKELLVTGKADGKGQHALESCKHWHPVEHLIIYNTTVDDSKSAELAAEGRRVLDQIPGVRATWSGRAIKDDAGYQWCWLIRFAHPAVIDSYREHPDHVKYADTRFRPIAGDRISIDYEITSADES